MGRRSRAVTQGDRVTFDTITSAEAFADLAPAWDSLVQAMARPSPFLLHGWLLAWWRHLGARQDVRVYVADRGGRLVGALPVVIRRQLGMRVAAFPGGGESALADLLLAAGESASTSEELVRRVRGSGVDVLDLFGLPAGSRVSAALGRSSIRLIPRLEAPILELGADWEAFYRTRLTRSRRGEIRRRSKKLAELGTLETAVARTPDDLEPALEDAFILHALRWEGRPDRSGFASHAGREFQRAALRALGPQDHARIVLLKCDGRPIAFHYDFVLWGRMYGHRLGFDPALARFGPGIINTLDALRLAAEEGIVRFEFLGGAEPYKLELFDRLEPLYQGFGFAGSVRGRVYVAARLAAIQARRQLKRVGPLHRLYYRGLAQVWRAAGRLRGTSSEVGRIP